MRRSQLNEILAESQALFAKHQIALPPFAHFTPNEWAKHDLSRFQEVLDLQLGWDVTDIGSNDFASTGLTLFTLRNGSVGGKPYLKPYAEKIMISREGQVTPCHFHWYKMEDIINRGGGTLRITLYNSNEKEGFSDRPVDTVVDGKKLQVPAGGEILLQPGQSITLRQGQYHQWQGVPGTGDIALFEVSTTNDDRTDNRFYKAESRLPDIEEDEDAKYLMFKDYQNFISYKTI